MTDVSQLIAAFRRNHPEKGYLTDKQIITEMRENLLSFTWTEQQIILEAFSGIQEPVGDMTNFSQSKKTDANDPLAKFIPQDGAVPKPKETNKGFWAGVLAAGAGLVTWIASRGKVKPSILAAGAAMLASCDTGETIINNNTDLDVDVPAPDLSGIETLIQKLIDAVVDGKNANSAENKEIIKALNEIRDRMDRLEQKADENSAAVNNMISRIQTILTEMLTGDKDRAVILNEILKKLEEDNTANLDILNKILNTVEGFKNGQDAFNNTATDILNEMLGKLDSMSIADKDFYNKVLEAIQDISIGNAESAEKYMEVLNNIWSAINSGNDISNAQTAILNDILSTITDIKNAAPEVAEQLSAMLQQVLDAVTANNNLTTEQTSVLKDILNIVSSISSATPDAVEKISGLLNEIITSVKEGTNVNVEGFKTVAELLESIKSGNEANTGAIIDTIKAMWEDIAAGNTEIINALKELSTSGAANNKELMEFIQGLYNDSQINSDERTDKIVDAINSVGQMVAKLENTVQTTGDAISNAIKGLSTDLKALLEAYQEGNATTQDVLSQLRAILSAVNEGNGIGNVTNELLAELLDKADQIINQGGDFKDYTEVLNEILDAINAVAAGIGDIKLSLGESNANITAALEEIINNQNIQTEALNKFAAESKANQEKLIEQGNDIIAKLDKIGADLGQGISTIIEKLKDSDAQLAAQLAALVDALGLKMDDNGQAIVNAIEGLKGNLTAIEDAINNLIKIAGNDSVDLTTTNNLIQTVINLLAQQEDPVLDLSEVTSLLAANNELLEQLLNKETGGTIDTGAIEQALADILEAVKNMNVGGSGGNVDLTTTNNLIQTCINQLSLLVQASSTNTDIMASVTNLGTQLTEVIANLQSGNVTTDEINAKLDEIMAAINSLTNSINA